MSDFSLILPDTFHEYEWELSAKGWFGEARLMCQGHRYLLMFYDPVRLAQEIEAELRRGGVFFEQNLIVVPAVTRENMEKAAAQLMRQGSLGSLVAE